MIARSELELEKHVENSHKLPCTSCLEIFINITSMETHIKEHHSYPCDKCETTYKTAKELSEHMEDLHSEQCSLCTEKLPDKSSRWTDTLGKCICMLVKIGMPCKTILKKHIPSCVYLVTQLLKPK